MARLLEIKGKELCGDEVDRIVLEYLKTLIRATREQITIKELLTGINEKPDKFEDGEQKLSLLEEELVASLIRIRSIEENRGTFRFSQIKLSQKV